MNAVDIVNSEVIGDGILPYLVEVDFPDHLFLRVKETLTRIGIPGMPSIDGKPSLNQTCHLLSMGGKYYVCHFKTMFILHEKSSIITISDIARQNLIIKLLQDWNLIRVVNPGMISAPICSLKALKIVRYQDRDNWILTSKYDVGAQIRRRQEMFNQ